MTNNPEPLLEVVVPHRCLVGEGPVWDTRRQAICWLDIVDGEIHEYIPGQGTFRTIRVGQMIGSFAVRKNGGFIGGLKKGIGFIDRETGKTDVFASPEHDQPDNRFNEGKCDPEGRFWAGTMAHSFEEGKGSLYLVHKDKTITRQIPGITISNGLAWSADHQIMYYIDTPTWQVAAFRYDPASGDISDKRIAIQIPEEDGWPDGMTIDTEGMLWIAHWDGWQVTRWDPLTGEKLLTISIPAAKVSSCTFGGEQFEDLYITTARIGLTENQLKDQPLAGSLFVWRNCGYKGLAAFEFDA
ncbi:MAG: SMP-30/gluconolactonase/LRE family protein [Bacteroidetes bacterium]|nr:SMP-30/gluconolactonase/LRE family protein [Bacteroidota bacterium]